MTLDVNDVLTDPDFCDTATVTRSRMTIGQNGLATVSPEAPFEIICPIVPNTTPASMIRLPDGTRQASTIFVYTTTELSAGSKPSDTSSRPADVLTWHGRQYVVVETDDWSAFGPGFWRVTCELQQINPP